MTNKELYINAFCHIKNHKVFYNHTLLFNEEPPIDFLKTIYQKIGLNYPKYFKMDNLCKGTLLAAEIALKDLPQHFLPEYTGVILANATSSYDTDLKHQQSIQDHSNYFPSPAIFVYTLPNITIGELCIRHKLTGENSFLIQEKFTPSQICTWIDLNQSNPTNNYFICGWADFTPEKHDFFIQIISNQKTGISEPFNEFSIKKIYDTAF